MAPAPKWVRDFLNVVDASKTERPETSEKLVTIPNGTERLKDAVLAVRKQVRTLEFDRTEIEREHRKEMEEYRKSHADMQAKYEAAYNVLMTEYQTDVDKNDLAMANARERLMKLWEEWARITRDDIGIYAALPGAEMPPAPPMPTKTAAITDIEICDPPTSAVWGDSEQ